MDENELLKQVENAVKNKNTTPEPKRKNLKFRIFLIIMILIFIAIIYFLFFYNPSIVPQPGIIEVITDKIRAANFVKNDTILIQMH